MKDENISGIEFMKLTCHYEEEPVCVNRVSPDFAWVVASNRRGLLQRSYRVLVATTVENLEMRHGDMWDTGWVESERSVNVSYEGRSLNSDTDYFWCVAIRDAKGVESSWAPTHRFTTALLHQADWDSSFIGPEVPVTIDSTGWTNREGAINASMFRHEFQLGKPVKRARAFFCGLGWGELHINGGKVGDSVLDPAPTDYDVSVPYVVHDVTSRLQRGFNAIGIMVGNGWYSEYKWAFAYGLTPKAMLQINIEYQDATRETLSTDATWKTINGPILENRLWGGESYDACQEQEGWTVPGFDDFAWIPVKIKDRCRGMMKAQQMPPVRVMNTIEPVEVVPEKLGYFKLQAMVRVFDMKVLIGGWSKIRVKGKRGQKVTIRYSDRLNGEGFVDQRWQRSSRITDENSRLAELKPCTDTYILKGALDGEVYEPRFTFHPLQYVQVEYDKDEVELLKVEGRHVYQDDDYTGVFECSNELFNKIHAAVVQTVKNQAFGIPLDCLNREHWGWVDPASIAGTFYPRQFMPLYWRKWIEDIRESQFANGAIPCIAPHYIYSWNNVDPIWGGSFMRIIWFFYQYYNDVAILLENYVSLKRLFSYHGQHRKNGILTEGRYGDHMIPGDAPGKEVFVSTETDVTYLWTGWYFEGARILSNIARVLGKSQEADQYAVIAEEVRKTVNDKWFRAEDGIYDHGSQTAQYYALAAGFLPEEHRQRVLDNAIRVLKEKYHGNHHTGNTGTTAMLDALGDLGRAEVLYDMINRTSYPSWGYMIDHGATTIWESWSTDNHVGCELSMTMYTTVDEFFYNELAGIKGPGYFGPSLFDKPGFASAVIAPYVPNDMRYARADIRTVYGRLASGWERKDDRTCFDISLPGNTDAVVRLPLGGAKTVRESGTVLWKDGAFTTGVEGISETKIAEGTLTMKLGSGDYHFEVL